MADSQKILREAVPEEKRRARCAAVWKSAVGGAEVEWGKWEDVGYWLARDYDEERILRGGRRKVNVEGLDLIERKFAVRGGTKGYVRESDFGGPLWSWWCGVLAAVAR